MYFLDLQEEYLLLNICHVTPATSFISYSAHLLIECQGSVKCWSIQVGLCECPRWKFRKSLYRITAHFSEHALIVKAMHDYTQSSVLLILDWNIMQTAGPEGSRRRSRGAPCSQGPFWWVCKRSFLTLPQFPPSFWKYPSSHLHRRLRAQIPEPDIDNTNNIQVTKASLGLHFHVAKLNPLVGLIKRLTNINQVFRTLSSTYKFVL